MYTAASERLCCITSGAPRVPGGIGEEEALVKVLRTVCEARGNVRSKCREQSLGVMRLNMARPLMDGLV